MIKKLRIKTYFLLVVITSIFFLVMLIHLAFMKDLSNEKINNYESLSYQVDNGILLLTRGIDHSAINIREYVITGDSEYLRRYHKEYYFDKNRETVINNICENEMISSACPSLEKSMSYFLELSDYELSAIEQMKSGNQQAATDIIFSENYINFIDKMHENINKFKSESFNIIENETNKVNQKISKYWYSSTILIFSYVFIVLIISGRVFIFHKRSIKRLLRDSLTGLGNHQALFEFDYDIQYLNCLVIDLIDFKFINQTFGHKNGDNVLIQVSKRISKFFSRGYIYRVTGSKFVVLTYKEITEEKLQTIISLLNKPIRNKLNHGDIVVNSSIGVALKTLHINSLDQLVDIASLASIFTQNKNINSYTFASKESILEFTERGSFKDKLDASIGKGTIYPCYQLIIDPNNELIVGMESFARWNKDGVILESNDFYEFSREVGLVFDVDITILNQALKDLSVLREQGSVSEDFFVSIKLSCMSLLRLDAKEILKLLNMLSLNPHNVQIEFTIKVFDNPEVVKILQELSEIGFRVLVGNIDFNLSRVNDLSNIHLGVLDILKYSLSKNRVFYELLLDLTTKLNLNVSVKGIESLKELKAAMNFKNLNVQGLYFSMFVEIDELKTELLIVEESMKSKLNC